AVFLLVALLAVAGVANAARPLRARLLILPSWFAAWLVTELAWHLLAGGALVAGAFVALGALSSPAGWAALVVMAAGGVGLLRIGLRTRHTLVEVRGHLAELEPDHDGAPRYPRSHVLLPPLAFRRRGVRHERGVIYARHG